MISALIIETLGGLVGNRCYPSTFPQSPTWPAIRFTISRDANAVLCGTDAGETDNSSVQIDIVDRTYSAMVILRGQVVAALDGSDPPFIREFENETFDTETKTHRTIMVGSFHPSSQ